jgi:DNA-3-methyladenine glycosylase I
MHYCDSSKNHPFHGPYHDLEYGIPTRDDNELFELLMLEINQAGLSWLTILKKRQAFKEAFDGFDINTVAQYGEKDIQRLLNNPAIIRNRLKIKAAIKNAQSLQKLIETHGSFANLLDSEHPKKLPDWVKWFKKQFFFMGPEIVNEFLMSSGYLPGAHHSQCPLYEKILALKPPWTMHDLKTYSL